MNELQSLMDQLSADPFNRGLQGALADWLQEYKGMSWLASVRFVLEIKRHATSRLLVKIIDDTLATNCPWSYALRNLIEQHLGVSSRDFILYAIPGRGRVMYGMLSQWRIRQRGGPGFTAAIPCRKAASLAMHAGIPLSVPRWMYLLSARGIARHEREQVMDENLLAHATNDRPR